MAKTKQLQAKQPARISLRFAIESLLKYIAVLALLFILQFFSTTIALVVLLNM